MDVFYASLQSQLNALHGLADKVTQLERRQDAADAQMNQVDQRCLSQSAAVQAAVETDRFNATQLYVNVQQLQHKQVEIEFCNSNSSKSKMKSEMN